MNKVDSAMKENVDCTIYMVNYKQRYPYLQYKILSTCHSRKTTSDTSITSKILSKSVMKISDSHYAIFLFKKR